MCTQHFHILKTSHSFVSPCLRAQHTLVTPPHFTVSIHVYMWAAARSHRPLTSIGLSAAGDKIPYVQLTAQSSGKGPVDDVVSYSQASCSVLVWASAKPVTASCVLQDHSDLQEALLQGLAVSEPDADWKHEVEEMLAALEADGDLGGRHVMLAALEVRLQAQQPLRASPHPCSGPHQAPLAVYLLPAAHLQYRRQSCT